MIQSFSKSSSATLMLTLALFLLSGCSSHVTQASSADTANPSGDASTVAASGATNTSDGTSGSSGSGVITTTPTPIPTGTPIAAIYHSCKDLLTANPGAADGNYALLLDNANTSTTVFCDMTTDGGGWTTILDGANADRAALNYFFDNTSLTDLPEAQITRDPNKGIFWTSSQYLIAKNMPISAEFRVIFSSSWTDPNFGTHCYAIMGFASPTGYSLTDPNSFTAFIQKNDTSDYVKSTFNATSSAAFQDVELNAGNKFAYPMVNGSRIIAGNPYGFGNTCTTFFFKRIMVR